MDKQYKIDETKRIVFGRANWACEAITDGVKCGLRLSHPRAIPQLAHRIKKSKANLKKYGDRIINHPLNMGAACGLKCNSTFDLGHNQHAIDKLTEEILRDIDKDKNITDN